MAESRSEIRVLSRKLIRPSSSTPPGLRTYKLSLLDQITPDIHNNVTFFYPRSVCKSHGANQGADSIADFVEKSQKLQDSLSRTLIRFYPLAGRFRDDSTMDCDDEGVSFEEAETDISLERFLCNVDLDRVDRCFLPASDSLGKETAKGAVILVKFIRFSCGGCALSLSPSHKILDLASLMLFLQSWTLECRGSELSPEKQIAPPDFLAGPSLLPSREIPAAETAAIVSLKKFAPTRLVFRASQIAKFKAKVMISLMKEEMEFCPSRVEVVAALIWRCIMTASKSRTGFFKPSALVQAANLRTRINPPLPANAMGNLMWMFPVVVAREKEVDVVELVKKLRAVRDSLQDQASHFNPEEVSGVVQKMLHDREENMENFECCICASWCKFPLMETDFGWGNPVWHTSIAKDLMSDTVYLMDAKEAGGVEALVHLGEEETKIFREDEELKLYASINPTAVL